MVEIARIRRTDVLAALAEYDELGRDGILQRYSLIADERHPLSHRGSNYDTGVVVAVAHLHATGELPAPGELSVADAAMLARALVFDVDDAGLPPLRFARASTVGRQHAHQTWALAARDRLIEVAEQYGSVISRADLATYVQRRSLINTHQPYKTWMGDVLHRVAAQCVAAREPFLSSLVVDTHGRVGTSYARSLRELRGEDPADPDEQASHERLACHRYFGAELPADGGIPVVTLTRAASARRARPESRPQRRNATAAAVEPRPAAMVCPTHFIEVPPGGQCDLCE